MWFGHWFTAEKFDERWSVDMLVAALEIGLLRVAALRWEPRNPQEPDAHAEPNHSLGQSSGPSFAVYRSAHRLFGGEVGAGGVAQDRLRTQRISMDANTNPSSRLSPGA